VWFQDEARIGQKNSLTRVWGQTGSRPAAPKDLGFASAYVFGAVCPSQGKAAALIMPICNTAAMNHHLREISSQVAADAHAVVILDGAGWHRSQGLAVPGNITLLELPPYSPELNPVERIWHYLRSHWLANSVFPTLADSAEYERTGFQGGLQGYRRTGSRFTADLQTYSGRTIDVPSLFIAGKRQRHGGDRRSGDADSGGDSRLQVAP